MPFPPVGRPAPDFVLPDAANQPFRLADQRGRPVVLFFYPEDDTPACTTEVVNFSQNASGFAQREVTVAGISPDSVAKHRRFTDKFDLRVRLLADPEHVAIGPYGVWDLKRNYGREYIGLVRTTFLVAADGTIAEVWPNIRTKGHAGRVLLALDKHLKAGR